MAALLRRASLWLLGPGGTPGAENSLGGLPRPARLYVLATILAGVAVLETSLFSIRLDQPVLFIGFLLFVTVTSAIKISLPLTRGGSTMSLSYAGMFASLLILGTPETVILGLVGAWTQCNLKMKARNPAHRTLFSMACLALTVQGTGTVYRWVGAEQAAGLLAMLQPLLPATVAYFVINTALVATAVALSSREALWRVWRDNFLWSAPGYFVGALLAALVAFVADQQTYWWTALVLVPLYLTYHSYRTFLARVEEEQGQVREASRVQMATVQALALAIEAKDRTSHAHLHLIQVYAEALGRAVGMNEREIRGLQTAALLHDIGHLAVPEHVLGKPGPLTYEEFQRVKIHSRVGADILKSVPFPYPVAPFILAHHEHWDGTGYPSGVQADAIPLGARVLAVADCFTALLADRPHRKAKSFAEAVAILRQSAGLVLDPTLVERFLEILPRLEPHPAQTAADLSTELELPAHPDDSTAGTVYDDIAVAHSEARALYEIAEALGASLGIEDVMALISSKLAQLVPVSCCALFLWREEESRFDCAYASGMNEDGVRRLEATSLERLAIPIPAGGAESSTPDNGSNLPLRWALAVPLTLNGRVLGALTVYHAAPAPYTDDHRRLLERVAEQAAPIIYNSIVFEETQVASLTDALTELPNRRQLMVHLTQDLSRAQRQRTQVAVLLLDLDHFKEINDGFGHHAGDRALREVAAVLRSALRPYDLCARYAGDEFVVVLWECDAEEAERKRRELQEAVATVAFTVAPDEFFDLAISAGAAVFPQDGATHEELLAVADRRMYSDKASRRHAGELKSLIAPTRR